VVAGVNRGLEAPGIERGQTGQRRHGNVAGRDPAEIDAELVLTVDRPCRERAGRLDRRLQRDARQRRVRRVRDLDVDLDRQREADVLLVLEREVRGAVRVVQQAHVDARRVAAEVPLERTDVVREERLVLQREVENSLEGRETELNAVVEVRRVAHGSAPGMRTARTQAPNASSFLPALRSRNAAGVRNGNARRSIWPSSTASRTSGSSV